MAQMVSGLARAPGIDLTLLASRFELEARGKLPPDSAFASLPLVPLPLSRALMERLWWVSHWPKVESYVPGADWIYCASDVFVPARKARLALTIHDVEAYESDLPWSDTADFRRRRRVWNFRLAPMLRYGRLILTVSEFSKSRIVQLLGVDPARVAVVYNGVDRRFLSAADEKLEPSPAASLSPYIALVGGLSERKGGDHTIAVARELLNLGSNLKLAVSGNSAERYSKSAKEFANIVELGFVPDAQLPAFMKDAVALFFPSRYEGFGIPILEAMACGTPAVAANFAALPEVAGNAGIVIDVTKPLEIAKLLIRLAENPKEREIWRQLGLVRARQFTWDSCVQRLVNALTEAV